MMAQNTFLGNAFGFNCTKLYAFIRKYTIVLAICCIISLISARGSTAPVWWQSQVTGLRDTGSGRLDNR